MPKFNEFIKGFEEKAETEQPKENRDQIIEKVNQKMMNAGTYGAFGDKENYEKSIAEAEELRKGLAPKAEEPKEANVRNWVKKNYPTEFQTENIRGDLTFDDLYKHMNDSKDGEDFYQFASEGGKGFDSAVREEIFNGMSEYHKKPYEHFYDLWLNGGKKEPSPKADSNDYPYDEEVLQGITRDTPDKAKKLAQALYAYRVTKDTDLAGKLFDEYLSK